MREPTSTEKAHPAAPQGKSCTKDAAGEASGDGTSRDLSLLVARTLRIGVALAGLIALVGGIGCGVTARKRCPTSLIFPTMPCRKMQKPIRRLAASSAA